ncbi:MAG: hypothetical protein SCH98_00670 [Deferrisomatales bacterium]|nr:hypothetical protein [Deferrisomatales bacterium]
MSREHLDRLERRIEQLRREYELFLAGQRRGEPVALREEIRRELLARTRQPPPSTAAGFRVRALALRFQAVEAQVRRLLEPRGARKGGRPSGVGGEQGVLLQRSCLEERGLLQGGAARLHRELVCLVGERGAPPAGVVCERLEAEMRRQLAVPGVEGVRFRVERGEAGATIRGTVVRRADGPG